ncbi:MAG: hypothetical protein NVSMB68_16700 [Thermoanaerobaculia bacterium]
MECTDLQQKIHRVDEFGDSTFRRFQRDVVAHYRRHEQDQERIAIALTDMNVRAADRRTRDRLSETLAMLDHVHDPLITGL